MMSTVSKVFSCWLCPDRTAFATNRELKTHLIAAPHSVMRVICPWCYEEEKTFRRVSDLKPHCQRHHGRILASLHASILSEANGFWFALHPEDYAKVIGPSRWESEEATQARDAITSFFKNSTTTLREEYKFKKGWECHHPKRHQRSPSTESSFIPDYEEELPAPKRKRTLEYSPSKPDIPTPAMIIGNIHISGSHVRAELYSPDQRVFWIAHMEDSAISNGPVMASLARRIPRVIPSTVPIPTAREILSGPQIHLKQNIASLLGIPAKIIRSIWRGITDIPPARRSQTSELQKKSQERSSSATPPTNRQPIDSVITGNDYTVTPATTKLSSPALPSGANLPVASEPTLSRAPSLSPSQDNTGKESTEDLAVDTRVVVPIQSELQCDLPTEGKNVLVTDLMTRAERILRHGSMPLVAPARREWGSTQISIPVRGGSPFNWPPCGWQKLSPDSKLLAWEYAAMTLDRSGSPEIVISQSREELLDRYNMLALPGTQIPAIKTVSRKARYYTYETLRQIATGQTTETTSEGIVNQIDQMTTNRDRSTELVLKTIEDAGIPLRLK